jgi:hypothetical protein
MMVIAIEDLIQLTGSNHPETTFWQEANQKLRKTFVRIYGTMTL